MRRCSLPFPASLPCSASGVEDRKWGCRTSKNPWKENKGLFKITSKVIINESSGKGAPSTEGGLLQVCCTHPLPVCGHLLLSHVGLAPDTSPAAHCCDLQDADVENCRKVFFMAKKKKKK